MRVYFSIPTESKANEFLFLFAMGLSLIVLGLLSGSRFRQFRFNWWQRAHRLTSFILLVATLSYARTSWPYVFPGALLWLIDHIIRFWRICTTNAVVRSATFYGDVLRLNYVIDNGVSRSPSAFKHAMGQYVYLNVPEISLYSWHPFSISSAAEDPETHHHIKCCGIDSFSGKLHELLKEPGRNASTLNINIEGPYGSLLEYTRYEKIIFVAGGIGVAPVHSQFKTLYVLAKAGLLPVTRVFFIWVAKDPKMFQLFSETFEMIASDSLHTR